MINVRKATCEDATVLAHIMVQSFRTAFADIVTPETMDRCTNEENCTQMVASILASGEGEFLLAYKDGIPCGELYWRAGEELQNSAEIVALHSLQETWGTGVGKALIAYALHSIVESGKTSAYLWAFERNVRARRFYEKCGFVHDGSTQVSRFDEAVEVRYVWDIGKQQTPSISPSFPVT